MQIIFQDPYASLNPRMTVGSIIGEALVIHKLAKTQARARGAGRRTCSRRWASAPTTSAATRTSSRAASASASASRARSRVSPKLIVADEPVSALDVSIQAQVINLLEDLQKQFNLTYLFIAHDLSVVEHISTRVAVMYLGKIVEIAPAKELYTNPKHPYTEALLSAVPIPDPAVEAQAHHARGRRAEPDQAALRLPLPHPLPDPGALLLRERAGAEGDLARPLGRLPGPRLALLFSPLGRGRGLASRSRRRGERI